MKYLLICNTSQNVITFRVALIKRLMQEGLVTVIAGDDEYAEEIRSIGVTFYCVEQNNRSLNLSKSLKYKKQITEIASDEKPDCVLTFQLKPNTFGVAAAHKAGVKNIVSMVEGAGDVFINRGLKWAILRKLVCFLYKKFFRYCKRVIFLNRDDQTEFVGRRLVKEEQCALLPGIGVNLDRFAFKPLKNQRTFLMVARMLKTKGIYEYCECARIVKRKYPDAVFDYLGAESNVTLADIREYLDDGSVNYLGVAKDVRPYLENCTIFMLPSSYREGVPMSIMEAEAVGRAVITSDNIGCKETVKDGYNGFLVPKGDAEIMAEKAIWCIEHPEKAEEMGRNARAFAEGKFNQRKINEKIIGEIL